MNINVKSPGRVNLIGGHTDYNGGYVLPCALNLSIELNFNYSTKASFVSTDLGYSMNFNVNKPCKKSKNHWENYVLGVVNELKKIKGDLSNFNCNISSTLPSGAGISSSSALVCGLIKGLSRLNNIDLDNSDIITISRNVEHKYIGLLGGIMDQYTIINAQKNMVILLNCDNMKSKFINLNLDNYKLLLLDTNVKHNLANTEYNNRVSECKKSLKIINNLTRKEYLNLSQVTYKDLIKSKNDLGEILFNRSSYIFEENQRTIQSAKLIESNKLKDFGRLMYQSHEGLRDKYNVSCLELDFLVYKTKKYSEILGSRMMGGGFGGCTVSLIEESFIDKFIDIIKVQYFSKFGLELNPMIASPDKGIHISII